MRVPVEIPLRCPVCGETVLAVSAEADIERGDDGRSSLREMEYADGEMDRAVEIMRKHELRNHVN